VLLIAIKPFDFNLSLQSINTLATARDWLVVLQVYNYRIPHLTYESAAYIYYEACTYCTVKFILEHITKAQKRGRVIALIPFGARSRWMVNDMLRPFYHCQRPDSLYIRGWLGLRAGLDLCRKTRPHRESIPGPSSPQWVAIPTTLSRPMYVPYAILVY
jgi:hypothetical protein